MEHQPSGKTDKKPASLSAILLDIGIRLLPVTLTIFTALCLIYFPYSTDAPLTTAAQTDLKKYYATAYAKQGSTVEDENSFYVTNAKKQADQADIPGYVQKFVRKYGLENGRVLDVGAGRGYLQDIVSNYVGLDISPSAKRFFHKPFILGSATYMPVETDEFDAAWTIWVLEHVPNPEAALNELRRVVKNEGLIYLLPAWDCTPYAADGYPVRPYSAYGASGKLRKAWMPVDTYFWSVSKTLTSTLRHAAWKVDGGPTRLHYQRLTPNYDQYWMSDSDAVNSLDRDETARWFVSRGDECLNCDAGLHAFEHTDDPLILRVHKKPATRQAQQTH